MFFFVPVITIVPGIKPMEHCAIVSAGTVLGGIGPMEHCAIVSAGTVLGGIGPWNIALQSTGTVLVGI